MRAIDLTGQRFGRLTAVRLDGHRGKDRLWLCRCACGTEARIGTGSLRSGNSTSCGCLRLERISTHSLSASPEYSIWKAARNRCHNPSAQGFPDYGARGIVMCDEWRASFSAFIRDMGRRPSSLHSLDRIDNDGPYAKKNCRWASKRQQAQNTRGNRRIAYKGENLTITEWAERLGVSAGTIGNRLGYGWPLSEVLTLPPERYRNRHTSTRLTLNGLTDTLAEWARHIGINRSSLQERLDRGWSVQRALTTPKLR